MALLLPEWPKSLTWTRRGLVRCSDLHRQEPMTLQSGECQKTPPRRSVACHQHSARDWEVIIVFRILQSSAVKNRNRTEAKHGSPVFEIHMHGDVSICDTHPVGAIYPQVSEPFRPLRFRRQIRFRIFHAHIQGSGTSQQSDACLYYAAHVRSLQLAIHFL